MIILCLENEGLCMIYPGGSLNLNEPINISLKNLKWYNITKDHFFAS